MIFHARRNMKMSVEGTSVPVLAPRSASTPPRREPSAKGAPGPVQLSPDSSSPQELKFIYFLAWLLCAIFYFYQYAVRSAPGVMLDDLTAAWGANKIGALISAYYTVYALMALVAGVLLDRYGARRTVPLGIAIVAVGCVVFAQGAEVAGMTGFVIQAIGAVFAFIGGSYVAARYLPGRMLAIFLGFTQCLGMAGAAFGSKPVQMAIDPEGSFHLPWQTVWIAFAVMGFALAAATWIVMPKEKDDSVSHHGRYPSRAWQPLSRSCSATSRVGSLASSAGCSLSPPRLGPWSGRPPSSTTASTCRWRMRLRTLPWWRSGGSSAVHCSAISPTRLAVASRC
jgi:MFS family permease